MWRRNSSDLRRRCSGSLGVVSVDDTSERIKRAALARFVEVGFGSTTVDDIAAGAGVGVASLYRRWPDKAALANELMTDYLAALEGMLEPERKEIIDGHAEVRETFKISRVGTIAGCFVLDGVIRRNCRARVTRVPTGMREARQAEAGFSATSSRWARA